MKEYLQADARVRVGLIHRLDRDASGLLILKNEVAYESLKRQFFKHDVERIYHAIVDGAMKPPAGRIESDLVERTNGTVFSTTRKTGGQHAITDYKTVSRAGPSRFCASRCIPDASTRYGFISASVAGRSSMTRCIPISLCTGRLMLAVTEMAFDDPKTGERRRFELPLPREMGAMFREISFGIAGCISFRFTQQLLT